jgi:hypothetical protein
MVPFIYPLGGQNHRRLPGALQCAALAVLSTAALTAQAQPAAKLDPLDPKATVPALRYESSFSQYRPLGDEKPVSWREANDTVARIGGWRVYAREAQQPDAAPAAKPASDSPASKPVDTPKPMPLGHGHDRRKTP